MPHFIIATRESKLALVQAQMIADVLLQAGDCTAELLAMTTTGDRETDRALLAIGGKGLFTKEIEEALLSGKAQIAMHSLKDMPAAQPPGLMLAGVLPRENPADWLITRHKMDSLDNLPQGAVIGTSSPRRAAQLLALRPDVNIFPFRGNVPTRLTKLEKGEVDATILAAAGLTRLGIRPAHWLALPTIPAIGQGIVAMQCRVDDAPTRAAIARINHAPSWQQMLAERAVLQSIGGDCHTPLAAHARLLAGDEMEVTAEIFSPDGTQRHTARRSGAVAEAQRLGTECGQELLPHTKALWPEC